MYATPTDEPRLTAGALPPAFAGGEADAPAASLANARDDAIMTLSVESVAAACAEKRAITLCRYASGVDAMFCFASASFPRISRYF